jgi:Recombination directionality factor-like
MALIRPGIIRPRLPEIGRIFKGSKKRDREKDGKTYQIMGEDLDHLRFEPSEQTYDLPSPDGNGVLAEYLVRQYAELGDTPRNLPIQLLHADMGENFTSSNEVWAKVGAVERCVRRCNGETQLLHLTEKKTLSKEPIACAAAEGESECPFKCKPTGRLSFNLPILKYPGLVVMTTHSIYDIIEIQGNLALYADWDLSKIPFQLCRTERTVNRNENGVVKPMKKWLCHLSIDPRFGNAVLAAQPRQYLAQLTGTPMSQIIDVESSAYITELPAATAITEAQRRRLFAIKDECGVSDLTLKQIIADVLGCAVDEASTSSLDPQTYALVVQKMEEMRAVLATATTGVEDDF